MTPEDLARLHPTLYHVTFAANERTIRQHGLHPVATLIEGSNLSEAAKRELACEPRRNVIHFGHAQFGGITINDNKPLVGDFASCLDDGLTEDDWLGLLNMRVFFFTSLKSLSDLSSAKATRGEEKRILKFDTLRLAQVYAHKMEIAPFNTGNTTRKPLRRGTATFAPLLETDYSKWRFQRGNKTPDRIREVIVRGSIGDAEAFALPAEPSA